MRIRIVHNIFFRQIIAITIITDKNNTELRNITPSHHDPRQLIIYSNAISIYLLSLLAILHDQYYITILLSLKFFPIQ